MIMDNYNIRYSLKISFSQEIHNHFFSLRCLPSTEARQKIGIVRLRLNADYYAFSDDVFGNHFIYGYKQNPHGMLDLYMETDAVVDWQNYDTDTRLNTIFKMPTLATAPGRGLDRFYRECEALCAGLNTDYEKAVCVMETVHSRMKYEKNVTDIKTTAEEAFSMGRGVCQDYAQIMIAVMRKLGIPARYVAGAMENEPLTHAWVEVYVNNRWYGFDPTNNLLVNNQYIVFSRGRDYKDCLVNKGIFFGPSVGQEQDILVDVRNVDEDDE